MDWFGSKSLCFLYMGCFEILNLLWSKYIYAFEPLKFIGGESPFALPIEAFIDMVMSVPSDGTLTTFGAYVHFGLRFVVLYFVGRAG